MKLRLKAKHPSGSLEYYDEPYTVQHFWDWLYQTVTAIPLAGWFIFRHLTSKKFRLEEARAYNQAMFGNVPTSQMYVMEGGKMRQLREEERNWPE